MYGFSTILLNSATIFASQGKRPGSACAYGPKNFARAVRGILFYLAQYTGTSYLAWLTRDRVHFFLSDSAISEA